MTGLSNASVASFFGTLIANDAIEWYRLIGRRSTGSMSTEWSPCHLMLVSLVHFLVPYFGSG